MSLVFYKALHYPTPINRSLFTYGDSIKGENLKQETSDKTITEKEKMKEDTKDFSRTEKNPFMETYINNIKKHQSLRENIPGVRAIYLCNSISFNALHEKSDIDLLVITQKDRIWWARFRTVLMLTCYGIRRTKKRIQNKYCLSFYLSEEKLDLQSIRLKQGDVYLPYRIAHLVPLYHEHDFNINEIYERNTRIKNYLPNITPKQNIFLGIEPTQRQGRLKKLRNKPKANYCISICNNIIGILRKTRHYISMSPKKRERLYIVINDYMLKFHKDKRRQYQFLFKKQIRSQR